MNSSVAATTATDVVATVVEDGDDLEAEMKLGVPPPRHTRIVVAGFGNALRGDDGAGRQVAHELAVRWNAARLAVQSGHICILAGHQPVPEWVPALAAADVVYFVDASAGAERLQVRRLPPAAATSNTAQLLDGHALGLEGLLALASSLYGHTPAAYLVTLPV
jgi:hydrogenase maturation protease